MIALDLSRLLSRAGSPTPSGIDRVELAYARNLIGGAHAHCFAARNIVGDIGLLSTKEAIQFVAVLEAKWRDGDAPEERPELALAARLRRAAMTRGGALRARLREGAGRPIYLVVSHQGLERPRPIARLKAAAGARFVCLIHDLIPLDFPDLTRRAQTRRHKRRIATVAALADAVIANSAATREALCPRMRPELPIIVAPLGVALPEAAPMLADRPYFVCIGTIEARKNHGLLLDIWRRLAAERAERAPHLVLIGKRGFGGDRIMGAPGGLRGLVVEHSALPDRAVAALLRGSRALLLPSLAEGFGLPVAEALALGVPVLCSDLPSLRESGGGVPDYLNPRDHQAWHRALLDLAGDSPRRRAQLARLTGWQPPLWPAHFAIVERLIDGLG